MTSYTLEICADASTLDQCLDDPSFLSVPYSGTASFTLDKTTHGLVSGTIYQIRWKAANDIGGAGLPSESLAVALANQPVASSSITKNLGLSSKTSIRLEWNSVAVPVLETPGGDILGYQIIATNPSDGTSWTAFDGVVDGLRDQVKATITSLTTGQLYSFTVTAYNFNGEGITSSVY